MADLLRQQLVDEGGAVSLQAAVDAFLDHHDLAPSTRRVYRTSLANLATQLGPTTALGEVSGPSVGGMVLRPPHYGGG